MAQEPSPPPTASGALGARAAVATTRVFLSLPLHLASPRPPPSSTACTVAKCSHLHQPAPPHAHPPTRGKHDQTHAVLHPRYVTSADAEGENALKIILLGDSAVGKSKLVERFLMQEYQPRMLSTYALTLFRHNAEINGEAVKVDFWDTAGQERFNSMHPAYYHQAHACILCFDVTRKQTYKNLPAWIKELREYRAKIPTICIANKVDVDVKVMSKEFGFPKKHNMQLCKRRTQHASHPLSLAPSLSKTRWPLNPPHSPRLLLGCGRHQRRCRLRGRHRARARVRQRSRAGGLCRSGPRARQRHG
jgi:Rab-like protein 2